MIYFFVFLILFLVLVVFLGAKADYDAAQEYKCPMTSLQSLDRAKSNRVDNTVGGDR